MRGRIYGAEIQTLGSEGEDRFNAPAPGTVHEGCLDDCARARFKESFAQGSSVWHAHADIFYQPGRARFEPDAQEGTRTGKIAVVEAKPAHFIISKAEGWNEEKVVTPQVDEG